MVDKVKDKLSGNFCGLAEDGHVEVYSNSKLFAESLSDIVGLRKDTGMNVAMPANVFPARAQGTIEVDTTKNTCEAKVGGSLFGASSGTVPFIGNVPK